MVVEDHGFQRRIAVRLLAELGVDKVLEGADGLHALDLLRQQASPPDVVLVDLGKQLYQQLLGSSDANGNLGRAVRWNYGWDLYRIGEHQAALGQWVTLLGTAGGPSWIPPTMALVLWKLDRKADAVAWYGAAVRTEPLLWTDARNYATLLPAWRQEDRDTLAEVLGAWQTNPPRWP